jgi:hypothetical protein
MTLLVIWHHETEKVERFLDSLKGLHSNVQFILEMERDNQFPFLDIDIYSRQDGSLSHKIYRNLPTQISTWNLDYITTLPKYKPVLSTLLERTRGLCDIKCVGLQPRKISSFLRPVKDDLGLGTTGVYNITCECGHVYIEQTGRSIRTRIKEHHRHIRLGHPDKSAVAEGRFHHTHLIKFQETWILCTGSAYTPLPSTPWVGHPSSLFPASAFLLFLLHFAPVPTFGLFIPCPLICYKFLLRPRFPFFPVI